MKAAATLILISTLAISSAQAQGLYIEKGLGVDTHYLLAEGEHTLGAKIGYGPQSMVDFSLFFERYQTDNKTLTTLGLGPHVGFYPLRQNDRIPVTLFGQAWYLKQFLSGSDIDVIEDNGGEASQFSWTVGGGVTSRFDAWGDSRLQPRVGVFSTTTTWEIQGGGLDTKQTDTITWLEVGIDMVVGEDNYRIFHVGPMLRFQDGKTTYGMTVGFGKGQ